MGLGIAGAIGAVGAAAGAVNTISGLVGGGSSPAVGNIAGSGVSAGAQLQAGSIQQAAAEKALAAQQGTTAAVTQQFNPFLANAPGATTGEANLLGFGPQGTAGELAQLQATPGYQFAQQQGLESVASQNSGLGWARSGPGIKGAESYASGLASQTYQNQVQNFINTGNQSLSAAGSYGTAALGGQLTANQLMLASGQAQASGLVGAANTVGSTLATTPYQVGSQAPAASASPATGQVNPLMPTPGDPYATTQLPSWYQPTQLTGSQPSSLSAPVSNNDLLAGLSPVNLGSS